MTNFTVHKSKNFTVIDNHVFFDENLSWKAKGLLTQIFSLPPSWDYTEVGLTKLASDGLTSTRSALKELEEAGYLVRTRIRNQKGRIVDVHYDVYETPQEKRDESFACDIELSEAEKKFSETISIEDVSDFGKKDASEQGFESADSGHESENPKVGSPLLGFPKVDFPSLENPKVGCPSLGFPKMDSPILENRTQYNTNIIKNITNKKLIHQQVENPLEGFPLQADDDEIIFDKDFTERIRSLKNDAVIERYPSKLVNEIFDVIVSVMKSKTRIKIAGSFMEHTIVQNIFKGIDSKTILKAAGIMMNADNVTNRKSYIQTIIWNELTSKKVSETPKHGNNDFLNFYQRQYDYDDLERQLLALH